MADNRRVTHTRRSVLALVGTTALAGCSGLPTDVFGDSQIHLDGAALRSATSGSVPTVPDTIPVAIEQEYLQTQVDRTHRLLSVVPTPFSSEEIPNGAIREKLTAMHEHAREALSAAETAASPYESMRSLRSARSRAGALNAAWKAIDTDLTREELLETAPTIRREVRSFRDRWEYVGTDSIRAVLVSRAIEHGIERAMANASIDTAELEMEPENPVTVGELGSDLERARTFLEDSGYLYDRYTSSLTERPTLGSSLQSATESLVTTAETRRQQLPEFDPENPSESIDQDIDETPAEWALRELYDRATNVERIKDERSRSHYATAILLAHEQLVRSHAFTALYEQITEGNRFIVDDVSDVESTRSMAIQAINTSLENATYQRLTRYAMTDLVAMVRFADRELKDTRDEVEPRWIARDVAQYIIAEANAQAVPQASKRVATVLKNAA